MSRKDTQTVAARDVEMRNGERCWQQTPKGEIKTKINSGKGTRKRTKAVNLFVKTFSY